MDQPRTISNPLAQLQAQIEAIPAEFATMRDGLTPPKFRAEVQRILTKLDSQVTRLKDRRKDAESLEALAVLETKLTAIRAGQE